jgi:hypothetical protein
LEGWKPGRLTLTLDNAGYLLQDRGCTDGRPRTGDGRDRSAYGLLSAEVEGEAGGGGLDVEVAAGKGDITLPGPRFPGGDRRVPSEKGVGGTGGAGNCSDLLFELTFSRIKCNRLKVEAFERLHVWTFER